MIVNRALLSGLCAVMTLIPVATQDAGPAAAKTLPRAFVSIKDVNGQYAFSPATLTIHVGTKVVWTNKSSAPHTVTGTGGWSFSSAVFGGNHSVSHVFKRAGTYHYMCSIHPYMTAKIVVRA